MKKINTILSAVILSLLFTIPTFAGWFQDDNCQWKYEKNGTVLVSQWIEDQGAWYYLDENGLMISNTTQTIDGAEYTFSADGKWISQNTNAVSWNLYTNTEMGYSLQIPSDVTTDAFESKKEVFDITSSKMLISFNNLTIPSHLDPATYTTVYELGFYESIKDNVSFIDKADIQLGELSFHRTRYLHSTGANMDFYTCTRGYTLLAIMTGYTSDTQVKTLEILNTLKIINN